MFAACLCRHLQCRLISDYFFFTPLFFAAPFIVHSVLYQCVFFPPACCRIARWPLLLFDCKRTLVLLCFVRARASIWPPRGQVFLSPSPLLSEGGKQCLLRRSGDGGESSLPVWFAAEPVGWLIYSFLFFLFFFCCLPCSEQLRRQVLFKTNI